MSVTAPKKVPAGQTPVVAKLAAAAALAQASPAPRPAALTAPGQAAPGPKSAAPTAPAQATPGPKPTGDAVKLSSAFRAASPGLERTFMDKAESFIGATWLNRLVKPITKYRFGLDHPELKPNPRITVDSAEFKDLKAHLKPGDVILCGNDDSFVHGIVYLGNGEIVHSLAQEKPDRKPTLVDSVFDGGAWLADHAPLPRSWREGIAMRFRALPRSTSDGIGVIHETLDSYFARASRDNAVILRNPGLTPDDLAQMKKFALAQVGKPYDYSFSTFDDSRMYCTEVVAKTLAQGDHPVKVQGLYDGVGPIKREMFLNQGILANPDLKPIWKAKSYENTPFGKEHPITIKP